MRIAVASGKGGTGKTTIATNLAYALGGECDVTYVDCDVEEPNGHIFLRPVIDNRKEVNQLIPVVDIKKCTLCGLCGKMCQYNAIAVLPKKVMVFDDLCHSCGGCSLVCADNAISEIPYTVGSVESGKSMGINFIQGKLDIGRIASPLVIRCTKEEITSDNLVILDAPPGTSCPVVESVKDTDYVLLVTEPTPFGLHDLKLTVSMIRQLQIPFGVVINRSDIGDKQTIEFCSTEGITIIEEIPDDDRIARLYSRGQLAVDEISEFRDRMVKIEQTVRRELNG